MRIIKYIICSFIFLLVASSSCSKVLKNDILESINKLSWKDFDFKVKILKLNNTIEAQIENSEVKDRLIVRLLKKWKKEEKKMVLELEAQRYSYPYFF